ncbi:UbiA prenyltransferase family protein [Sphaerisporangium sp. NPDC004334]
MSGTSLGLPPPPATVPSGPRGGARSGRPRDLLALLRPHQWAKNLLVVPLPLVDPAVWRPSAAADLVIAVVVFILASSLVYVGNDIADRERDRRHPVKRRRPIAAGRVSVEAAVLLGGALLAALVATLVLAAPGLAAPVVIYLTLNVLYSAGLKHVPLVDVFIVVSGFEARVVAGYVAVGSVPSAWLLLCLFFLCMTLILGKRRRELDDAGTAHRPSLAGYSTALLDQMVTISAGLTTVVFLLFLSRGTAAAPAGGLSQSAALLALAPLGLFGLFRYMQMLAARGTDGDPVRALLRDRAILFTAALCAAVLVALSLLSRLGVISGTGWPS